ncbi:MAG: DHA2 family efflux MFS transporter permease subunit [bacterium]
MATIAGGSHAQRIRESEWYKWAVALTVSLGALMEVIDVSIVNVALPSMQSSMGATLSQIGWVITGYAMANVVIIPLGAWLSERFGQRNYYLFTLVAFVASSVLCGLSTSLGMLVVARILQGLFGGGLLPKAQSILFETFPPHQQGMAQALFGIGVVVGPAFGPTLGGYLTDMLGWRWIFFINLPVGILAVLMALLFVPDKPRKATGRVDLLGILLLAAGLGSMQVLLEQGREYDWFQSGYIVGLAVLCVTALFAFVRHELRVANPAVNLRVLKYRPLWAGSLYSIVLGVGLYGTTFVIPVFTQNILHFTATQTGELMIPGSLIMIIFMPLAGILLSRLDARILVGTGSLILVGMILRLSHVNSETAAQFFFWPLMWRGMGLPLMFIPLSVATLGTIPKDDVSSAAGLYNLTRQIGGSLGIAVLTFILDRRFEFHYLRLSENVGAYDPAALQFLGGIQGFLQGRGYDMLQSQTAALKIVSGLVQQQAMVLSFEDVYLFVAALFVCALPLLLILGRGHAGNRRKDAPAPAGH